MSIWGMTRVEFFGGPLDGNVRYVPEKDPQEIQIAMLDKIPVDSCDNDNAPLETRIGKYVKREDNKYHWQDHRHTIQEIDFNAF